MAHNERMTAVTAGLAGGRRPRGLGRPAARSAPRPPTAPTTCWPAPGAGGRTSRPASARCSSRRSPTALVPRLADIVVAGWLDRPAGAARPRPRPAARARLVPAAPTPSATSATPTASPDTLAGVAEHVDYLRELGTTYLHLMPLLQPRAGANDGGYAVADYRDGARGPRHDGRPREARGGAARQRHRADHRPRPQPRRARARVGRRPRAPASRRYRDYFHVFPDRTEPDALRAHAARGVPGLRARQLHVGRRASTAGSGRRSTTYQWDLNWSNPDVCREFADLMLFLANRGVDCLRLDAIAFLWKRLGTDCQNQPEVHGAHPRAARRRADRRAVAGVQGRGDRRRRRDLVKYLGVGEYAGACRDLAYHNSLMVQIWSALATRDARLLVQRARQLPAEADHDRLGDVPALPRRHRLGDRRRRRRGGRLERLRPPRASCREWYVGEFPGSFARGAEFQVNEATGDSRISGTRGEPGRRRAGARGRRRDPARARRCAGCAARTRWSTASAGSRCSTWATSSRCSTTRRYLDEPAHAEDNRWMHRPRMPWDVAARRHDPHTLEGRMLRDHRSTSATYAGRCPSLHAAVESRAGRRPRTPRCSRCCAGTPPATWCSSTTCRRSGSGCDDGVLGSIRHTAIVDRLSGGTPLREDGQIVLPPYAALWLTEA